MELINAVQKISERKKKDQGTTPQMNTEKLKTALSGKLALHTANGIEYVNIKDIIRIEADGSYSIVYTIDKKKMLISKNLKFFEESLEGESFFRTHKSHIINIEHLKKYYPLKDGGCVEMADGSEILVSRSVKPLFVDLINQNSR
ncbi:MAG: hypothetical protein CVU05_02210 [Bacteroidetes bacterium HGW-Bacteroidetes-21]|jgi:two-component system LytT family response regulator|nr:MAG: hypothetical protein CVU05_02210 [Bacteroidetes bacterium HGW-Bacteroidetes-21]